MNDKMPPFVIPGAVVDPTHPLWNRLHPYDPHRAWQDVGPDGEYRIYPSCEAATADGMPYAAKVMALRTPQSR